MKKMLLVLLSVLLVFSSCWCAFSVSAEDAYFETLSNWSCLGYTSKTLDSTAEGYVAAATSWQNVKTSTAAGTTKDSTTSIVLNGHVWATIPLPNIEKNTTYQLTYNYKSVSPVSTSTNSILGITGILAPEVAGNVLSNNINETTGWLAKYRSKQLEPNEATTYNTADVSTANGWYTNTITFDSGNNTNLLFALYVPFGGNPMKAYLDNIKLESLGATPPMIGNPNEASGWQVYKFADATSKALSECTPADSSYWAKITDNTTQVGDYTGSSLKVAANSQWSVANFAVEKNTEYVVSFDYYSDTLCSNALGSYAFSSIGVVKSGGQIGATSDDNLAFSNQNTSYKGPYSSRENNTNYTLTTVTGQWQQMSLEFNSLDNEYVGLYFATAVNPVYVKNVSLIKIVPDVDPFEVQSNWGFYKNNVAIDGTATANTSGWPHISIVSNYAAIEGEESVNVNNQTTHAAIAIPDLKANTKYTLSVKYMIISSTTQSSNNPWIYMHIVEKGTKISAVPFDSALGKFATTNEATLNDGNWREATLEFETGDSTDLYFTSYGRFGTGCNYYLDDFILEEVTGGGSNPIVPPPAPSVDYFDNLENWGLYTSGQTVDGTVTVDKVGWQSGSINTNAKYCKDSDKSINIYTNGAAYITKLQNLKANTKYKVTLDYLVPANATKTTYSTPNAWFTGQIYKHNTVVNLKSAYATKQASDGDTSTEDQWFEYTLEFETDDTTDFYLSLASRGKAEPFTRYFDNIAVEEVVDITAYDFEDVEKWGLYTSGQTVDGTVTVDKVGWQSGSINTNAKYCTDSDKSINIYTNGAAYITKLQNHKANTKYKVTLDYLVPANATKTTYSTPNAWFTGQIYKHNTVVNLKSAYATKQAGDGDTSTEDQWFEYTLEFETDDTTDFYLSLASRGKAEPFTRYFDNIAVEEVTGGSGGGEPTPPPVQPSGDVNDASAWKVFPTRFGTDADYVIGEHLDYVHTWANVTDSTAKVREGTTKSLKFSANSQRAVSTLKVEKNKDYTLKFYYYSDTIGSSGYIFSQVQVLKKNGQIGLKSEDNLTIVAGSQSFTGPASAKVTNIDRTATNMKGMWIEFATGFNSGDNEEVSFALFSAVDTVYVNDITLTEGKHTPSGPDMYYGEVEEVKIINFEDPSKEYITAQPERFEVISVKNENGEDTNVLHVKKGNYSAATNLDQAKAQTSTHPVYTLPVKSNKVYKLSLKIKIDYSDLEFDAKDKWLSYGIYAEGSLTSFGNVSSKLENNKWYTFTHFVSPSSANCKALTFFFNAGKPTPDMWIDDITLTETEHERFKGHERGADSWTIDFDSYYVGLSSTERMEIAVGPERDGTASKALHVFKGEYPSGATLLNWGAVSQNKDPVFTFPVEENTLYKWSAWFYIPRNTGSLSYFAFWHNFHGSGTDARGIWRGENHIKERDNWVKCEVTFVTDAGQTMCSTTFNLGETHPEIWIDDIKVEKVPAGTSSAADLLYCENLYDISDDISNAAELDSLKSGVYKLPVGNFTEYTFAATVTSGKAGDSLQLSLDGTTPMPQSKGAPASSLTFSSGKREGFHFVSDKSGYVYIIVNNNSGTLKAEDIQLFARRSRSTNREMGRLDDPNVTSEKPSIEELETK